MRWICIAPSASCQLFDGIAELLGDKAYDSNSFRKYLRKDGIKPVMSGRSNRKKRIRHDKQAYKDRNVSECCYCGLKDFRRISTRHDKLARNYFSVLCLVAAVAFWLDQLRLDPNKCDSATAGSKQITDGPKVAWIQCPWCSYF